MMPEARIVVLNADDYAPGRYESSRVLKQAGYEVIEVANGTDARTLARESPDLILLDIVMPDNDGLEVCRRLKSDPHTSTIPIVHMSASALDADSRVRGLEGGADAYLTQPVEPRELIATIQALLRTRKAEEATRNSEARFRALIEATAEIVWTASADGQRTKQVSGWGACAEQNWPEGNGTGWLSSLHPDDLVRVSREWEDALRTGSALATRCRLQAAIGGYCHFAMRAIPVKDADGTIREWIGIFINMDEQNRLEEAQRFLSEASAALSSSLDYQDTLSRVAALALPALADWAALEVRGPDGELEARFVAHPNPVGETNARLLLESHEAAADGTAGTRYVLRTGVPEMKSDLTDEMLVASAQDSAQLELLRSLAIKSYVIVPLTARERILGVMMFATDRESARTYGPEDVELFKEIARRAAIAVDNARLYGEAIEASKVKSEFLAVMSHELRTPMNAIIGYADLLDTGVGGSLTEAQQTHIQRINVSVHHLISIIDQILTFSRVEAGGDVNQLEEVDLAALVHETAQLILPLAQKKEIGFQTDAQPGIIMHTDSGKLRQIVLNLLSNAVKFTDEGSVDVSSRMTGEEVHIVVRDTGIGIQSANLGRIFDPFWQVEQSMNRRVGGSGLGLGVTRGLAKLLGGDVTAASETGKGSTFTVTLPLRAPETRGPELDADSRTAVRDESNGKSRTDLGQIPGGLR